MIDKTYYTSKIQGTTYCNTEFSFVGSFQQAKLTSNPRYDFRPDNDATTCGPTMLPLLFCTNLPLCGASVGVLKEPATTFCPLFLPPPLSTPPSPPPLASIFGIPGNLSWAAFPVNPTSALHLESEVCEDKPAPPTPPPASGGCLFPNEVALSGLRERRRS